MRPPVKIFILVFGLLAAQADAQIQTPAQTEGKASYIRAMEAFENEEYQRSADLLLKAYNNLGSPASIAYSLADVYYKLGNLPNAALYGKQAVNAEPDNKWYRLKLAEIYRDAGQNQATLDELNKLLEYHTADIDALFMLADTYKKYGEFLKSNQVLNRALKLTGPNRTLFLLKFENFEALGVRDSMRVQLEALRDLNPDDIKTLNLLSEFYALTGEKEQAKTVLNEALERNSRDPQSLINLAGLYLDAQKWDSAGTAMGNFISDKLISPDHKMELAKYLYTRHTKDPENVQLRVETGRLLDLFCEAEPDYGLAFIIAGQFYAENNQPEEALIKLAKGTELRPGDELAWRLRLQLLAGTEQYKELIETGKKADEQIPQDAFIQFFTGTAYFMTDNLDEAVTWLENASAAPARRPFKSAVYSTLGDVYAKLNRHEDSDRNYEMALRYDPENALAMNNYAYHLSVRAENLDQAKELALKAIEKDPDNAAYLDTVGWVYYKLGDYERARRYVKAALDTGEASAEVAEHLGDIYEKLENFREAGQWWQKALEMDETRTHLNDKINSIP